MLAAGSCSVRTILQPALLLGHSREVVCELVTSFRNFCSKYSVPPSPKYGGKHTVTMIPGDGIGPELMVHVKRIFRSNCVPVEFEEVWATSTSSEEEINNALMAIRRNRITLKGNIATNHHLPAKYKSHNTKFRTALDLYASVVHFKTFPGVETRHKDIDILVVRENTEGEYTNLEHESVRGVVESLKIVTKTKSVRIADYAFRLAQKMGRKKVTVVHKANIMKLGDGLFLQCCKDVAAHYPQITLESMIIDNTAMQLVSKPQQFDVMLMPNLYGNIINSVCTGLVGGSGIVPGANYGDSYAIFETGSKEIGQDLAHRNIANPVAMLLTSCIMLDYLDLQLYAAHIRSAVMASLQNKSICTPDIGGQGTTAGVVEYILDHMKDQNSGCQPRFFLST
ncbi:rCG53642 [Rattus norvegicus]|uniref:Probable isocitrate dehydrogenase [NAD] gamma 2, mitochondrial n=2 Tax=Rattus norvegicus TaxID=10116 RepID=IDHG2_RAT|nr:probable isocitrate dehydrogenase [NAD] gamma 2, mitochondrial [Rattus norvegicus]Q4QQT5.1 RecName: Full=Probable isocitrate dehydrogenase [NAD] gamma 2, mitochondrial; AltName: Full=Isocitric dehydrogenase subunit gamma 2; AltName: Full=NAD(+)-specific ICDH subunit gamma 2; Flags: Precursor [Rattus norvegicus]AAH98006.1 LOC100125384 protein [Rattus norvegicus]EDM07215.1 rCG53642 [Rattus norvegicus]|eukprot:NP_001096833.1 probable isocitrate dehydrogenase [NAD] gamma 2, mitochondrial [Rattus norvegicus]